MTLDLIRLVNLHSEVINTIGVSQIEDKASTLNAGAVASIDFTGIPATYKTLELELLLRTDRAANTSDKFNLKINNDGTAANYQGMLTSIYHSGQQASEEFLGTNSPMPIGYATAVTAPASTFAHYIVTFPQYANTNIRKDFQVRGGGRFNTTTGNLQMFDGIGHWISTAAINRLTLTPNLGTNFVQYCCAILRGYK